MNEMLKYMSTDPKVKQDILIELSKHNYRYNLVFDKEIPFNKKMIKIYKEVYY